MLKLVTLSIVVLAVMGGGAATNTAQADQGKIAQVTYTHDFITATVIVGRFYGSNVKYWLQNCSSSEGGHGGWVWRDHIAPGKYEDKPGGWMQFFKSTFDSNVSWAFQDARHRGLRVQPKARNYYEPLGQAIVAGAMYARHGNPGTWTGARC